MKKITIITYTLISLCFFSSGQKNYDKAGIDLKIDGSKRFQQIDGIGVNANTASWDESLKPALNMLLDSMNATIWRVIVESVEKWEDVNDNNDPFTFNWDYYNKLYETPKFQKVWDMIRYLNQHGITDKLMINFMGAVPLWMGGEVVKPEFEDEYIEMLVSFFYYARNVQHLHIGLISPMNESDIRREGPTVGPKQYVRLLKKMIYRMKDLGLGDIPYVAPDVAGIENGVNDFLPELMTDSVVMSKIAHLGLHSYYGLYTWGGNERVDINAFIKQSSYPKSDYWVTEWNAWCDSCDNGILGEYNYNFSAKCVDYLLSFLKNGATAGLVWEGYDSYYEHHSPAPFSYWGMLAYDPGTKTYSPRKNFYAIQQVSKFVLPGAWRVAVSEPGDSLIVLAFHHEASKSLSIVGINKRHTPVILNGAVANLPDIGNIEMYYTSNTQNLHRNLDITVNDKTFKTTIPADCIFTLTGTARANESSKTRIKPEPSDWYSGDMHIHRDCGGPEEEILPENKFVEMMKVNDLAVISVLADMGNAEVKPSETDLLKVTGKDHPLSIPGRTIHYDAEWHWDPYGTTFEHKALGGHVVLLGMKEAKQIWEESTYKILDYGRKQNAIVGFCHLQYLNDSIQNDLNCCIPIEHVTEIALGMVDFIAEDVYSSTLPNNGNYNADATINAYYKFLNCGFKLGLAAGTDYPCNSFEPFGSLLTYVQIEGPFTYRKWVEGIKEGRTVVTRNGHKEFLDMKVNGQYIPGDEIKFKDKGSVSVEVKWTANESLSGKLELVYNGKVVASQPASAEPGKPVIFKAGHDFTTSGWICVRRMGEDGHHSHTAPVYLSVNNKPVRASSGDAMYYAKWIDNMIEKTSPGGDWNQYFSKDLDIVQGRYKKAKSIYLKIAEEAKSQSN